MHLSGACVGRRALLDGLEQPGLYSWWVDAAGAREVSTGLGAEVAPGRIYAGQAGATKWPSGKLSTASLGSRIRTQHLGGNIYGSTFRFTLASSLFGELGLLATGQKRLAGTGEARLSAWIREHLSVAVSPYPSRDALGNLEDRVLGHLDPPLNLDGMGPSEVRARLTEARKHLFAPGQTPSYGKRVEPVQPSVARGPRRGEQMDDDAGTRWTEAISS